jgi:aerobic C4-dicarboxylate transport protein
VFGAMAYTIGKFGTGAILNLIAGSHLLRHRRAVRVRGAQHHRADMGFSISVPGLHQGRELLIVLGTSSSKALPSLMEADARLLQAGRRSSGPDRHSFNLDGTNICYDARTCSLRRRSVSISPLASS